MCIVDMFGLNKFIDFGGHFGFKQPIELFFRSVEITFNQFEDTFGQLKDWLSIQNLILGTSKHDCFQDDLYSRVAFG